MAKASAIMNGIGISADFTGRGLNGEPIFENKEFTNGVNMSEMIERIQRAIPVNGTQTERTNNYNTTI